MADEFGPESSALKIDADALARYLAPRIEGVSGALRVQQFAGGQSNPTYHLACGVGGDGMRRANGCCARSRRARCYPPRTPSIASTASSARSGTATCRCRKTYSVLRRHVGDRHRVLRDGVRTRTHLLGRDVARAVASRAQRDLRRDEPRARRVAPRRLRGTRPRRLRQARQLLRTPDQALDASNTKQPRPTTCRAWSD